MGFLLVTQYFYTVKISSVMCGWVSVSHALTGDTQQISLISPAHLLVQISQYWRNKASRHLWRPQEMAWVPHNPTDQRSGILRILLGKLDQQTDPNGGFWLSGTREEFFANFHRPLGQLKPYLTDCASTVEVRSLWRSLLKIYCPAVMNVVMGESLRQQRRCRSMKWLIRQIIW